MQTAAAMQVSRMTEHHLTGGNPPEDLFTPIGVFAAGDGYIMLSTVKERQFGQLCALIGEPALAEDPRFRLDADRQANKPAMKAALEARLAAKTAAEWSEMLGAEGLMCMPVQDYDAFLADAQVAAADYVRWTDQAPHGPIPVPNLPGAPPLEGGPAPALGAHTKEVLTGLGLDAAEIARMIESEVVVGG